MRVTTSRTKVCHWAGKIRASWSMFITAVCLCVWELANHRKHTPCWEGAGFEEVEKPAMESKRLWPASPHCVPELVLPTWKRWGSQRAGGWQCQFVSLGGHEAHDHMETFIVVFQRHRTEVRLLCEVVSALHHRIRLWKTCTTKCLNVSEVWLVIRNGGGSCWQPV